MDSCSNAAIPLFWLVFGFIGQALFTGRMVVQWLHSEKKGKSVVPLAFWYFSLGGSLMLLTYAIFRHDPVIIVGQMFGVVVYVRNLMLLKRERKRKRAVSIGAWSDHETQLDGVAKARHLVEKLRHHDSADHATLTEIQQLLAQI